MGSTPAIPISFKQHAALQPVQARAGNILRIEMVVPTLAVAGMEVMVARMAGKFAERGHDVGIACVEAGGPLVTELADTGVRVTILEAKGFIGLDWVGRMSRHFRSRAPDILHVHSGCWLKSAIAGRLAGSFPIILTAHGFVSATSWKDRLLERAAVPLTHHLVAVSDHLRSDLVRRRYPSEKMSVIINGIDTALFDVRAPNGLLRRKLGLSGETCIVGTVARLEPIKNQVLLVDAIAAARQSGCDCAAVLIGEGSLRPQLEQRARDHGIADSIHFWGVEPNVASLYAELDIFTLTSTAEGTSISLLEAMASGICPLVTAVGGNVDVLDKGRCGMLIESGDSEQLADAIRTLAADRNLRQAFGRRAREHVVMHFSEGAMLDSYEALYRRFGASSRMVQGK